MSSISRTFKSGLILLALVTASGVFAASWFANGPKRDVVTLVVTGNYKSPRLMAELILYESRQPYLLLPTPQSRDQRIIYVQAKGAAHEIPEKSLRQFIKFLNPHRIFILGDDRYVPAKYVNLFDRNIPVVRIEGSDWNRVADETTLLLGLSNLSGDYRKLHDEITKGKFLRPTPRTHRQPELKKVEKTPAAVEDNLVEAPAAAAAPAAPGAVEVVDVAESVSAPAVTPAKAAQPAK